MVKSQDILPASFFEQETVTLAQSLLGKYLVHELPEVTLIGEIVETEAYLYPNDPAAHSFRGQTPRTEVMFKEGGLLYVFFTYGMHFCCNVTSAQEGEAVLIRAIRPVLGLEKMQSLRGNKVTEKNLTNGPAKAAQALALNAAHNGLSLLQPPVYLTRGEQDVVSTSIVTTTRIGISQAQELPLRFYLKNSPWVSRV